MDELSLLVKFPENSIHYSLLCVDSKTFAKPMHLPNTIITSARDSCETRKFCPIERINTQETSESALLSPSSVFTAEISPWNRYYHLIQAHMQLNATFKQTVPGTTSSRFRGLCITWPSQILSWLSFSSTLPSETHCLLHNGANSDVYYCSACLLTFAACRCHGYCAAEKKKKCVWLWVRFGLGWIL